MAPSKKKVRKEKAIKKIKNQKRPDAPTVLGEHYANPQPTKIRITEDAEAKGATAEAYDYWRAGSGRTQVPGIIKCFGARPDFLKQVVDFSNTVHFSAGHLIRRHKEMIASYVSFLNRCRIDSTVTPTSCVFREPPTNAWKQFSRGSSMKRA